MSLGTIRVRNEGNVESKLWLIGEAPGESEELNKRPFVGAAGQLLFDILNSQGINREDVFLGNLCQYRPYKNQFRFCVSTPQLQNGILELMTLIKLHHPNVVVLLGANPLFFIADKKGIGGWRGSILFIDKQKYIPSYHPAAILREYGNYPILAHDLKRAISDSQFPEPRYPTLDIVTKPDESHFKTLMSKSTLSCDIETTRKDKVIKCIGFGYDWTGISFETDKEPNELWIRSLLECERIEKVFHLGAFDQSVMEFLLRRYTVHNYRHDTIVQAHILQPELPRGLDFLCSVYTRMPYYKREGREAIPSSDTKAWSGKRTKEELLEYNAKDCIATIQSHYQQIVLIDKFKLREIYEHEMELNHEFIHMSSNGVLIDEGRREELRVIIKADIMDDYILLTRLIKKKVNVRSYIDMPELLYKDLGLPVKKKRKRDAEDTVTTDEDALVSLMGHCVNKLAEYRSDEKRLEWAFKLGVVKLVLRIRGNLKLLSSYINPKTGNDGRMRALFKAFGTETGRASAVKYVDDTGMNLQTVPRSSVGK